MNDGRHMDDRQLQRYSRQIMLPQIDIVGQEKLLASNILIIGAGGLGCPAAMYLAAAGIGKISIADHDQVDLTNLQRQIAHSTDAIGKNKTDSLQQSLAALNPDCQVETINEKLTLEKLASLLTDFDLVLDCSDNFATRFAINAACVQHRVPLVSGAAIRFEGQIMVYEPALENNPCYRCLYPDTGEVEESCSENGVIAPLVGIIGSMQALEAIKLLTGTGQSACGRLILFDGLTLQWREIKTTKDERCPVCAAN